MSTTPVPQAALAAVTCRVEYVTSRSGSPAPAVNYWPRSRGDESCAEKDSQLDDKPRASSDLGDLHVLSRSHITVTREIIDECAKEIHGRAVSSTLKSIRQRLDPDSSLVMYLQSMSVLEKMLEIDPTTGVAQLVLDPARRLGLTEARPTYDLWVPFGLKFVSRAHRLRHILSTKRAANEGFKFLVQGMANMTDGAPWPWKAIPQTLLQFTNAIELAKGQPQKVEELTDKIAQRIAFLLSVAQGHTDSNTEINTYIEVFFADVQRIIIRLRMIESALSVKAFVFADYFEKVISGEANKMQDALEGLQARFTVHTAYTAETIARGVAAIQSTAGQTLAAVVETRTEVKAPLSQIPARAKLPARPIVFKGRDDQLNEIVGIICKLVAAGIAVMGPGGVGKTSLALAVLHDSRVIEVIGDHRFFISVEGMIDIGTASTLLANHLDLEGSSDPFPVPLAIFNRFLVRCSLWTTLRLYGFSTLHLRVQTLKTFLSRLAEVPSVTLLVTSRGTVPPSGVEWSNAEFAKLAPLSLDAARDTFIQIAKAPSDVAEREALDILLGEVGLFSTCWDTPIHAGPASKLTIRSSSKGITGSVAAHDTWRGSAAVAGYMRSIARRYATPSLWKLAEHFNDVDGARDLLVEFALVTVGAEGELKMLSPIRYFIYFDIAASAPQEPADDFTLRSTQFAPEYGNLTSFLMHLINSEEPSKKFFDAVEAVSEYAYCTMPSPTLREALLLRLTTQTAWRAECLQGLGRTRLSRDEYSHATDNLQAARILFAELGNRYQEAECRSILGNCMRLQVLYDAAEAEQRAARDIFIELGYEYNAAQCTQLLGEICRRRGEYDQAIDHLTSARDTFKRYGVRIYAAQCTQIIGRIQLDKGNLSAAGSDFQSALSEFEALGEQVGATQCIRMLGERAPDKDPDRTLQTAIGALVDCILTKTGRGGSGEL
ncbi:hypothetical protein BKA62DRAFT_777162 [Auriculariales sp. MPI-PUGE-AT-0066]|nr:hypothetical protein BKA62DRAFT_777162 [Auriculariales sp. MPI-PUGE-AT-0066]